MTPKNRSLFPKIESAIQLLDLASINNERKVVLQPLIDYIQVKVRQNEEVRLNFICTHNSRRSHLSQVWAQALAAYYGIANICCYSGGTEATAMFPMAADTLKGQGFEITPLSAGSNPVYSVKFAINSHPVIGFSKAYDNGFNPLSNFAAILTCSQADAGCPFIAGTELRIPITFEDPKAFDDTPQQAAKYQERSIQIATELAFVFSNIIRP